MTKWVADTKEFKVSITHNVEGHQLQSHSTAYSC